MKGRQRLVLTTRGWWVVGIAACLLGATVGYMTAGWSWYSGWQ